MDWICPSPCGAVNGPGATRCEACGARRTSAALTAAAPQRPDAPEIPEYPVLTPAEELERAAAVKALLANLTRAATSVERLRPGVRTWQGDGSAPPDPEDITARVEKARAMLEAFKAHNAQQGVTW